MSLYIKLKLLAIKLIFNNALLLPLFLLLIFSFSVDVIAQVDGSGPTGSFSEANLDDTLIRNAVGNLFKLIEGAFGALVMVVAGILAIIAAAMGGYRAALGMLIVALGAFILRALVSLFFGADFSAYQEF